jgi:hypothetical protein
VSCRAFRSVTFYQLCTELCTDGLLALSRYVGSPIKFWSRWSGLNRQPTVYKTEDAGSGLVVKCRYVSGLFACLVVRMVVRSWAYASLSAAVIGVRQVSALAAVQNDSAPNCVPSVADDRCVSSV